MDGLDYAAWIERERRVRTKISQSSPVIQRDKLFCVCAKCGEICLCHEEACPNCNASSIVSQKLANADDGFIKARIKCHYRFEQIAKEQNAVHQED